jgi:hypothetical protein
MLARYVIQWFTLERVKMIISHPFIRSLVVGCAALLAVTTIAAGGPVTFFDTGTPDGLIGTASRPGDTGSEIETADDFVLSQGTIITGATFTGLLPSGASLSSITDVNVEFYRVFPLDSTNPPSGNVPTRVNSPSDTSFGQEFDTVDGSLTITTTLLNSNFTVANTVVNGINPSPNQFTGGEGAATGEEVLFTVTLTTPFALPADHYFFRPEVGLSNGNFLWLSAPKPISGGTGPFSPDLQSWIRNQSLEPDWLRIGTDITGQGPFNDAFSLIGEPVPEPSSLLTMAAGLVGVVAAWRRKRSA